MVLTGKAKEEFINYVWSSSFKKEDYKEYENYLDNQEENHTYSDIIEWFDSVGVYISLNYHPISNSFSYYVNYPDRFYSRITTSRQEATKQAIEKANEIYNNGSIT